MANTSLPLVCDAPPMRTVLALKNWCATHPESAVAKRYSKHAADVIKLPCGRLRFYNDCVTIWFDNVVLPEKQSSWADTCRFIEQLLHIRIRKFQSALFITDLTNCKTQLFYSVLTIGEYGFKNENRPRKRATPRPQALAMAQLLRSIKPWHTAMRALTKPDTYNLGDARFTYSPEVLRRFLIERDLRVIHLSWRDLVQLTLYAKEHWHVKNIPNSAPLAKPRRLFDWDTYSCFYTS